MMGWEQKHAGGRQGGTRETGEEAVQVNTDGGLDRGGGGKVLRLI